MTAWVKELFGREKPVIAMAHVPALPGTPRYDVAAGIDTMIKKMEPDIRHLRDGGVDAIMFCNEDDRPYVFHAGCEQVAAMTRIITELRPRGFPFGVDFLWDPEAALCIAAATGASFVREVFTGVYEADMGLWSPDAGALLRLRRNIGAEHIRLLFNVAPEFCSPVGSRSVAERARSAVVSSLADAILVSGPMAGAEPDYALVKEAKLAVEDQAPIFLNTGAKPANVAQYLQVADGVIVGSSLKVDGYTWNPVDPARVRAFMEAANRARQQTWGAKGEL
jgi:membrane complex biogenesis BtpA family protein